MYKPNQSPEQYFKEIKNLIREQVRKNFVLVYQYKYNINSYTMNILAEELVEISNQVLFEFYYVLYLLCEEKHSISYYYKEVFSKKESAKEKKGIKSNNPPTGAIVKNADNINRLLNSPDKEGSVILNEYVNFKEEHEYNRNQREYKNFRTYMDALAAMYYKYVNVGLFEQLKGKYEWHKLRKLDYLFLERIYQDADIEFLFDVLRSDRILNNKKVSNNDILEVIFPAIQKLYTMIGQEDYCTNNKSKNAMLRSIDYYQLEKNCSFELSYMASYALGISKKTLKEKEADREVFSHLRFSELIYENKMHMVQNKAIWLVNRVFNEYIEDKITAEDVQTIYAGVNGIIYVSLYNALKDFFSNSFDRELSSTYWVDIFQNNEKLKGELGLNCIDDFMCDNTELFFNRHLGGGQHINKKILKWIKPKDFREMYRPL